MSSVAPKSSDAGAGARHVAIIMDGNGRWARKRHLPRVVGHQRGVEAVRTIVRAAARLGLEALTLYAFSTENWRRPEDEISALMGLMKRFILSDLDEFAGFLAGKKQLLSQVFAAIVAVVGVYVVYKGLAALGYV